MGISQTGACLLCDLFLRDNVLYNYIPNLPIVPASSWRDCIFFIVSGSKINYLFFNQYDIRERSLLWKTKSTECNIRI